MKPAVLEATPAAPLLFGQVSVAIQAHPSREHWIPYLHAELGAAPVAWSREPETGVRDVWATHRAAKLLFHPAATFHLVIQDDALVGRNFWDRLHQLLVEHPAASYSLFYRPKNNRHFGEFNRLGHTRLAAGGFMYKKLQFAVAHVVATALIPELVMGCDELDVPGPGGQDDTRMSRWMRARGIRTFYALPSLVSHRPEGIGTSGRPNAGRRAWRFQ
jgi:hypothetical protein